MRPQRPLGGSRPGQERAARGSGTASRARPGAFVRGPLRPGRIPRFVWRAGASPRPASCSFVSPSPVAWGSPCLVRRPHALVLTKPACPHLPDPGVASWALYLHPRLTPRVACPARGEGDLFGGQAGGTRGRARKQEAFLCRALQTRCVFLVSVQHLSPCRTWWSCGRQKKGNSFCPLR